MLGSSVQRCALASIACAILLAVALAAGAVPAIAADPSSGESDTNIPLVINPQGTPTTHALSLAAPRRAFFIQRMPSTKTIQRVTLGDFARGANCTSDANLELFVYRHPGGGPGGSGGSLRDSAGTSPEQMAYSTDTATATATAQRLTWSIPDTLLKKGHAYSFEVKRASGCGDVRQTTWPHTGKVEGGYSRCQYTPPIDATSDNTGLMRMWHTAGMNDYLPACITNSNYFDGSMPQGWLATSGSMSRTPVEATSASSCPADRGLFGQVWATPTPWYGNNVLCYFAQFLPHGDTSPNGWYYALPWRSAEDYRPRDMFVRLDTIDYHALLQRHSPYMRYDSLEEFRAIDAASATDPLDGSGEVPVLLRVRQGSEFSSFLLTPLVTSGVLNLATLGDRYPDGTYPDGDSAPDDPDDVAIAWDILDLPGNDDPANREVAHPNAFWDTREEIHARAVQTEDGSIYLQYWLWYYFNDARSVDTAFNHEGDWENITVKLSSQGTPIEATYAQHTGYETCPWSHVERSGAASGAAHPHVYVALGRHASYFRPHDRLYFDDRADGAAVTGQGTKDLEIITKEHRWLHWPGRWGATNNGDQSDFDFGGPTGPNDKPVWEDPANHGSNSSDCSAPLAPATAASRAHRSARRAPQPTGVAAPVLRSIRRIGNSVHLRYRVGTRGRPRRLKVVVRARDGRARGRFFRIGRTRRGSVRVRVPPETTPPYWVSAGAFGRDGVSRTVTRRVP
jgi:hypothetical protein